MISRLFSTWTGRFFAAGVPLLALFVVCGCDADRYPEDLTYPVRTDPLIDPPTDPSTQPTSFDAPGDFPQAVLVGFEKLPDASKAIKFPSKQLTAQDRVDLKKKLEDVFGTPAHPKVAGIDDDARAALKLDDETLAKGSELFRRNCLQCHGLTGDGRGHTAGWINPHPRDFRKGMFKFTSSSQRQGPARKARREDLLRTVRQGIEGTAMPSFGLLPEDDLEALVSYVIHLSLRGESEAYAIFQRGDDKSVDDAVADGLESFVGFWRETEKNLIKPPAYPVPEGDDSLRAASITRGFEFFAKNCLSCHENYGRRDVYKYDAWGTIVRPADLTLGNYRGGRRPLDLYWRIHSGINGSQMPATVPSAMNENQVWDVVNFVQALPYKSLLPDAVRAKIYPPESEQVARGGD